MTRTMYDGVNPSTIPHGSELVAGYVDGPVSEWPADAWSAFPGAIMVRLTVLGGSADAEGCDVEREDLTPATALDWVEWRRSLGFDPFEYCPAGMLFECRHVFDTLGLRHPWFWVADPDYTLSLGGDIVALQRQYPPGYDVSEVVDFWPGIDTAPVGPPNNPPIFTPTPPEPRGPYMLQTVNMPPTDANGNGWEETSIPWSTFCAVTHQGSDPAADADDKYWPGSVHAQERGGFVLLSLTGAVPNQPAVLYVLTT